MSDSITKKKCCLFGHFVCFPLSRLDGVIISESFNCVNNFFQLNHRLIEYFVVDNVIEK